MAWPRTVPDVSSVSGPEMAEARGRAHSAPGQRWNRVVSRVVLAFVAAVFVVGAIVSREVHDENEQRLLDRQTDEAATILAASISELETPLLAAVRAASASDGDESLFVEIMSSFVGDDAQFSRAALFEVGSTQPRAQIGDRPRLLETPDDARTVLAGAEPTPISVIDLLARDRTLGYAAGPPDDSGYVVYAERTLSADPSVRRRSTGPFSDIEYAIYLGASEQPEALLGSSVRELSIDGRRSTTTTPFGDSELLLVATPIGNLGSPLLADMWWIMLASGAVITTAAALLIRQLNRSRERAVVLAHENEDLYHQQREIAETLQLALLPQRLVGPPGSKLAARYWPAAHIIGGDFYDAFQIDDHRWGMTIGDVCGQGTEAAALTGLVRHTLRSVARYSYSPAEVLRAIHVAVGEHEPSTFCTVCLITFTPDSTGGGELIIALGGHPQPLLRRRNREVEAIGVPGTLLGMVEPTIVDASVTVEPGDTLVLYTDGLTDAPRDQAVPLSEVEEMLVELGDIEVGALADSIRSLKRRRRPGGSSDDTAMLVVRFGPSTTTPIPPAPTDANPIGEQLPHPIES